MEAKILIWNDLVKSINPVFDREIPDKEKLTIAYDYLCNGLGKAKQDQEYKGNKTSTERLAILQNAIRRIETILSSNTADEEKIRRINGVSDPLWGCTDPLANNWNPDAIYNDGSCEYYAETPPEN
jgi:hypothetical protein